MPNQFNKAVYAVWRMELRVAIRDGLLDRKTHRIMKMVASYVSAVYGLTPDGIDLEGAVFENVDEALCQKIVSDIETRFRRQLRYIEVECL
jgi:CheY-specific phosphatase CheX